MKYLHTMVRVHDLDASLKFYRDALGLVEVKRTEHEAGRFTLVYLAASPEVEGVTGKYFHDERESRTSAAAMDMEVARRLWDASVRLAGPAAAAA